MAIDSKVLVQVVVDHHDKTGNWPRELYLPIGMYEEFVKTVGLWLQVYTQSVLAHGVYVHDSRMVYIRLGNSDKPYVEWTGGDK